MGAAVPSSEALLDAVGEAPWGPWSLVARGAAVGEGGFAGPPREGVAELRYTLADAPLHEEVVALLVDRAFAAGSGVDRVVAFIPADAPAVHALERLGFTRAGGDAEGGGPVARWERARHGADGFLGTWAFDPARAAYEAGEPPRDGLYVLAPRPDGVAFTVDWTDPAGNARHVTFETVFGEKDGLVMERPTPDTLITRAPGGPVSFARRVLDADRRVMTVSQEGLRADGAPFANVSVYVRTAWAPQAG